MENKMADMISSLRKSLGFSQEELAEKASINLRTVQRIESGTTVPRGFTLRAIADALGKPVSDFMPQNESPNNSGTAENNTTDKNFLILINLSALSFWISPLLNILAPFAIWVLTKDKSTADRNYGARLINFQITWSLIASVAIMGGAFAKITHTRFLWAEELFFAGIALYIANTCFILFNTFMIRRGIRKTWFFAFPVIRQAV